MSSSRHSFFERYNAMVISRARSLLGDGDDAQDATQEVFVRVLTRASQLLDDPAPHGWLYRVTTNICFNRLRDRRRRGELLAIGYHSVRDQDDRTPETRVMLLELLDGLPREVQIVALYHYVDEMTYDEIANRVGVSRRTIGSRLLAFKRRLARLDAGK